MKKWGCLVVFMFVLVCSFVSAGISLSKPLDVYNLGDRLDVKTSGIVGAENGNLNFGLVCGNLTTNLARLPATSFPSDEESEWNFYKILRLDDLEIANYSDIIGECQITAKLGEDGCSTNVFTISDDVAVTVSLDKTAYNPGEAIMIRILATKTNGDLLNGFVEGSNITSFSKAISDGVVSEVFTTSDTIEAGNYYLDVRAYDTGKSGILNEGSASAGFSINQVASSLVMSLGNDVAVPEESFSVGVEVYDQSGVEMSGTVDVKFISPNAKEFAMIVQTGDFGEFNFNSNATVGTWRVIGSFGGIIEEREFEMAGVQKANFSFEGSVLTVTNIGNVVYNRSISVGIGNESKVLNLNIGLGEVRKFNLKAPSGEYDVSVDDGVDSSNHQVLLTGKAISVSDLKDVGIFKGYSIVWVFLIIVVGGVGFVLFRRYRKTKTVGGKVGIIKRIFGKVGVARRKGGVPSRIKTRGIQEFSDGPNLKNDGMADLSRGDIGSAEATLVLKGEKDMSAVVAISVKDYNKLSDVAKSALQTTIEGARKMKGLIDWRGDYIFVVFSPVATKTYKNEDLAVKAGMGILNGLNSYNKKFRDKIKFGIGIHAGELVASKDRGKLKYTSIGNTVSLAKRIADSGDGKLLISDGIRKKLIRDLKILGKKEVAGNQVYEVSEIKNRAADIAKLKDLLKRQGN